MLFRSKPKLDKNGETRGGVVAGHESKRRKILWWKADNEFRNRIRSSSTATLDAAEHPRDHILLRILLTCALRPSEAFPLRLRDVLRGRLRIDEAVVMGSVGQRKTDESKGFVPIAPVLQSELRQYVTASTSLTQMLICSPRLRVHHTIPGTT